MALLRKRTLLRSVRGCEAPCEPRWDEAERGRAARVPGAGGAVGPKATFVRPLLLAA